MDIPALLRIKEEVIKRGKVPSHGHAGIVNAIHMAVACPPIIKAMEEEFEAPLILMPLTQVQRFIETLVNLATTKL